MTAAAQDEPGAGEYTRVGTLSDAERAWDRQLADAGHTALAWRILGRDTNGHLVAATTLGCGHDVDVERYCTATFTPDGLVYRTVRRPKAPAQNPQEGTRGALRGQIGQISADERDDEAL